jgi:hypothetical protein
LPKVVLAHYYPALTQHTFFCLNNANGGIVVKQIGIFFRVCLIVLCFAFLGFSIAEAGYWQQEPPVTVGVDDKPCVVGKWPDQNQWIRQVYDFSATHVTYGYYHPQVQKSWTQAKSWWQAPPAILYPKQQISFQYGVSLTSWSNWLDAKVWLYRMSGPGGPDDQLGYASVTTSNSYTTKIHVVPEGFNGEAPQGTRLRYQMGATNACKTIFSYKWIPDQTNTGVTPNKPQITTEPNTDRYGSDYKCLRGIDTPATCRNLCVGETECRAYTWVKPGAIEPDSICCLKNASPQPTRNDNCVSGTK